MHSTKTTLQRAFELARSGRFRNVPDLRRQLKRKGYQAEQVAGPALILQLRDLMRDNRAAKANRGPKIGP